MLIECRARRKPNHINPDGGTKIKLFGRFYHFKPRPDLVEDGDDPERHLCEVKDDAAVKRFLSIAEQFNKYGAPPAIPAPAAETEAPGQPPVTTELIDDDDTLGDPDADPADPLAGAKEVHKEWIEETLAQSAKTVIGMKLDELDDQTLVSLNEAEAAGQNRVTVHKAIEAEQTRRAASAELADDADGDNEGAGDNESGDS